MSTKTTLIKNTTINLIGHFYLALASLITIPIILKNLGAHQFGLLALITSLVSFSSIFNLGLNQATIRYLALYHHDKTKTSHYFRAGFLLTLLLSLILFLAGFTYLKLTNPEMSSTLLQWLILILILLNFLTNFFNTLPQAHNNFTFYNLKTFLVGTTNTFLTAYLSFKTSSLIPILIARLIAQTLTLLSQILYARPYLFPFKLQITDHSKGAPNRAKRLGIWNRLQITNLLSYGLKKFLGLLSARATFNLPRFALASFLPLDNLPLFTIPQGLIANLQASLSQLTTALFPLSTTLLAKNKTKKLKRLVLTTELFVILASLLSVLTVFLFGQSLLTLWLKNPSLAHQITPILKILTLAYSLSALSAIPATILDALGKPEIPAKFATLNLTLQIIFLSLLIPQYGLLGVPLAILAHNTIQVPLFLYRFNKEIRTYLNKPSSHLKSPTEPDA